MTQRLITNHLKYRLVWWAGKRELPAALHYTLISAFLCYCLNGCTCTSVYLPFCLSVFVSVILITSIYLSTYLFVYMYLFLCLSFPLSTIVPVFFSISVWFSICLFVHLYLYLLSIYFFFFLWICIWFWHFVYLCPFYLPSFYLIYLSVRICFLFLWMSDQYSNEFIVSAKYRCKKFVDKTWKDIGQLTLFQASLFERKVSSLKKKRSPNFLKIMISLLATSGHTSEGPYVSRPESKPIKEWKGKI